MIKKTNQGLHMIYRSRVALEAYCDCTNPGAIFPRDNSCNPEKIKFLIVSNNHKFVTCSFKCSEKYFPGGALFAQLFRT